MTKANTSTCVGRGAARSARCRAMDADSQRYVAAGARVVENVIDQSPLMGAGGLRRLGIPDRTARFPDGATTRLAGGLVSTKKHRPDQALSPIVRGCGASSAPARTAAVDPTTVLRNLRHSSPLPYVPRCRQRRAKFHPSPQPSAPKRQPLPSGPSPSDPRKPTKPKPWRNRWRSLANPPLPAPVIPCQSPFCPEPRAK